LIGSLRNVCETIFLSELSFHVPGRFLSSQLAQDARILGNQSGAVGADSSLLRVFVQNILRAVMILGFEIF
jgi:hypothetical protein